MGQDSQQTNYEMKQSISTGLFIVLVTVTAYLIGALPGYFFYHFKTESHTQYIKDVSTLLTPFFLFIGLNFIQDRQGFFFPLALIAIGLCVSLYYLLSYSFPSLNQHHWPIAILMCCVIACWIFFPSSRMRIM